jgi:hypothetical protein
MTRPPHLSSIMGLVQPITRSGSDELGHGMSRRRQMFAGVLYAALAGVAVTVAWPMP